MADLVVPPLGESITEAIVAKWLKQVGDPVAADEPLAELETDKITVQLPAPVAGVLSAQTAKEGTTVKPGDVIGAVEAGAQAKAAASPPRAPSAPAATIQAPAPAAAGQATAGQAASRVASTGPALAGQAAAGQGAPPTASRSAATGSASTGSASTGSASTGSASTGSASTGSASTGSASTGSASTGSASTGSASTGQTDGGAAARASSGPAAGDGKPNGNGEALDKAALLRLTPSQRVQAREVGSIPQRAGVEASAPATAAPAAAGPSVEDRLAHVDPRDEVVAMSPLRKRVAERLVQAQHEAASLTTFNEVDMTQVMDLRAKYKDSFEKTHGVKLGFMSFFVRACVAACKLFPGVNAEVIGGNIVYKKHYDFGIAVSTPKGLVVPVLRGCDGLSFAGVEKGILALADKARTGKLALADLTGGTFSITNGGIYGSMMSTPLLNYPQTGILGMHNIVKRAVVVGEEVTVRPMMYVALSYDHRVVDGREAVSFLVAVKERLEAPDRLLIEV